MRCLGWLAVSGGVSLVEPFTDREARPPSILAGPSGHVDRNLATLGRTLLPGWEISSFHETVSLPSR